MTGNKRFKLTPKLSVLKINPSHVMVRGDTLISNQFILSINSGNYCYISVIIFIKLLALDQTVIQTA